MEGPDIPHLGQWKGFCNELQLKDNDWINKDPFKKDPFKTFKNKDPF